MPRVTDPSVLAQLAPPGGLGGVVIGTHAADPMKLAKDKAELDRITRENTNNAAMSVDDIDIKHSQAIIAKQKADEAQANAQLEKMTPNSNVHGDAYLRKFVPPEQWNLVRAYARGDVGSRAGGMSTSMLPIIQHAMNFDPSASGTNFAARVAMATDLAKGGLTNEGGALQAAERMLFHGQRVLHAVPTLNNFHSGLGSIGNLPRSAYENATGNKDFSTFNELVRNYSPEAQKAIAQTAGGQSERQDRAAAFSSYDSPESIRAALQADAMQAFDATAAVNNRYKRVMGKDITDALSPEAKKAYDEIMAGGFDASGKSLQPARDWTPISGAVPGNGGTPPPTVGGVPPRSGPPGGIQGSTPINPGGGPAAPAVGIATGGTRNEPDPVASAAIERLIREGKSPQEIAAAFPGRDITPEQIVQAQAYLKGHPNYSGFVNATNTVPTTLPQQIAGSPLGAGVAGAANAITSGFNDELAGGLSAMAGGDYTQARDLFDAKKKALAAANPGADLIGNIAGGVGTTMLGGAALKAAPGTLGLIQNALGRAAPIAGDAAYGALYGAGENNDNRLAGGGLGALVGAGGGALARKGTQGLSRLIAPTGGDLAPLYQAGVFPTLGQRFGKTGTIGRAINTIEQGAQSIPFVGSAVGGARQAARDQFQLGAFNDALGEIGAKLPDGTAPGTVPHVLAKRAFDDAYDAARSGMQFTPDKQYLGDLQGFMSSLGDGTLTKEQADQVGKVIQSKVGSRLARLAPLGGVMDGETYKLASSDLGKVAQDWSKTDPLKANALNSYISIFDDAARRNSTPDAVNALDAADRGYAKLVRLQRAAELRGGDAGTFSPSQLDRSIQSNSGGVRSSAYNQGDALMQDYGDAGKSLVDTLNNSGTEDRRLVHRLLTGGAVNTLTAGAAYTHPLATAGGMSALIPYLPGVRNFATKLIAPRASTLPSILADPMNAVGAQIYNRAGAVGRIGAPGAIGALSLMSPDLAFLGGGQ